MTDEDAVLEELMGNLGEASKRIRASRRLLLEHAMMDESRYLQSSGNRRRDARIRLEASPRFPINSSSTASSSVMTQLYTRQVVRCQAVRPP